MTFYAYGFPRHMARHWMATMDRGMNGRYLRVNVRDEGEAFVLTAPVPGLTAENLKIQVLDDVVRLDGEFPADEAEYLLREAPGGPFSRELRLPSPLDADKIEARIADGVLTLRLPKAETARPKTIKVAAA